MQQRSGGIAHTPVETTKPAPAVAPQQTLGESRTRVSFNPSGSDPVNDLKKTASLFIDQINELQARPEWPDKKFGEFQRLKSLAMTAAEESAMWAVKAATI